jgi:hypothetical protein
LQPGIYVSDPQTHQKGYPYQRNRNQIVEGVTALPVDDGGQALDYPLDQVVGERIYLFIYAQFNLMKKGVPSAELST